MVFDQSKQPLKDMQADTEQLERKVQSLTKTLELLRSSQTQMSVNMLQNTKQYKELTSEIERTEKSIKKTNKEISNNSQIMGMHKGSIQQNKELLNLLNKEYDELTTAQGNNSKQAKELNIQIAHLTDTIAGQEEKLEKSREVFDYQAASIDVLSSSFDKIKDSNENFAPVLNDVTKGFNAMKTGISAVKTGFQSVGGAIKTTGFGLLVLVLQSLVSYFTETAEGSAMLRGALSAIGLVIDNVKKVFQGFGKVIVDAVSSPAETIKKVWNAVLDNITNRFKGVSVFFDGLFHGNLKKMGDGVIQMSTGITNGTDKIKTAIGKTKEFVTNAGNQIAKAYEDGTKASDKASNNAEGNSKKIINTLNQQNKTYIQTSQQTVTSINNITEAEQERVDSVARMTEAVLEGYAKEVAATNMHFEELKKKHATNTATVEQLEKERVATLAAITKRFQDEELTKLEDYEKQVERLKIENITNARQRATELLDLETKEELAAHKAKYDELKKQYDAHKDQSNSNRDLAETIANEKRELTAMENWKEQYEIRQKQKRDEINGGNNKNAPQTPAGEFANQPDNANITQIQQKLEVLKAVNLAEQIAGLQSVEMHERFTKQKFELELELNQARMKLGDKFLDNVLKNSKKDSAIFKAAFIAKKATAVGDIIISTRKAIMESLHAYAGIPFIGQALGIAQAAFMAAQGATSIAQVVKQKPGYARGGQFVSDGRGALLSGYSLTDNTNAYLRSGEAVVVSEAMRNPWARNLVSAINVAHGGRDFSTRVKSGGYALGGVFTDGGNANRYYAQPVNDVKDLANTLAYQIINNFPP
ncbi:MAG: hypothetical protein EOP46_05055, partial [Sphingobacteriaceae bacterium]